MRAVAVLLAIILGACRGETSASASPKIEPDFVGNLVSMNGESVGHSTIQLKLYTLEGGDRRYWIDASCFDGGYFDARRGRYFSSSAPDPERPGSGYVAPPHEAFCDLDDTARQRTLREWLFEGANISLNDDGQRATLTTPTAHTAEFLLDPPVLLMD